MIRENLERILENIRRQASGRNVRLLGVTKTVDAGRIQEAIDAGLRLFGENRIQEALPKMEQLKNQNLEWHFIGHLQTNKARDAVRYFSCIQSVDSIKLLRQIQKEADKISKVVELFFEVNIGNEETKHGFVPEMIESALSEAALLPNITARGLMAIPPYVEDPEQVRPFFRELRALFDRFVSQYPSLTELSMGMSHDYLVALQEGSTLIRIGSALFGSRNRK